MSENCIFDVDCFYFELFVLCDVWHKVGENVNFEYENMGFPIRYHTSLNDARNDLACNPEEFHKNTFIYKALFKFPSGKELVQLLVDQKNLVDDLSDTTLAESLLNQNVKISSRIDPE
jgi:hypothetical protein